MRAPAATAAADSFEQQPSRASARAGPRAGRQITHPAAPRGGDPVRIEQHQHFEFALGGAPADQCADRGSRSPPIMYRSLCCNAMIAQRTFASTSQKSTRSGSSRRPRRAFVATIERGAVGDAAGLAVEPGKTPALAAEPADILVRIAPAGELPIEDAGQLGAVQHVVAGAEIAVAQHRVSGSRQMGFEPANAPFEHRARLGMTVEIGAEAGDLLRRPDAR